MMHVIAAVYSTVKLCVA